MSEPACFLAALAYAAKGWRVLPVVPGGKAPIGELVPHGVHDATTDTALIRTWWDLKPRANVGLALGGNLWALDVDPRNGGHVTLEDLERLHGPLPTSLREKTGGGGLHILFRHPGDGRISGKLGPGLDVKGDGGYIVVAPSIHPSGGSYVWLDEEESVLEAAPLWLVGLLHKQDEESTVDDGEPLPDDQAVLVARRKLARAVARVREGLSRHHTAVWLFQQCRDNRVPRRLAAELVDPFLAVCSERKGDRTVPKSELRKAISWAYARAARKPDEVVDVRLGGRSLLEIAAIPSDIERHKAIRAAAQAEGVPLAAVRAEVDRQRRAPEPTDDWRGQLIWRETNQGRKLEPCVRNAALILSHHEAWKGLIRANRFASSMDYVPNGHVPIDAPAGRWTDLHTAQATEWLQATHRLLVGTDLVHTASCLAAEAAAFHPVREYLEGLAWDQEPRLDSWLEDLAGVDRSPYASAVGRKWLVSAVARAFRPGCKADHVLILEGRQGIGKSQLLAVLAGDWYTDELDVLGSKDSVMQLLGRLVVEVAELDAMSRSEISRVKAFFARSTDRFRPPYGRSVMDVPRTCVFAGTVNEAQYLRDETGGRRFWPVACHEIDLPGARASRDQLWAEAVVAFRAGETWWLDTEDHVRDAEQAQEHRFQADAWEERIAEAMEPHAWKPGVPFTVSNILSAIGVDVARQDRSAQMRAAACLRRLGREMTQLKIDGKNSRVWLPAGQRRQEAGL